MARTFNPYDLSTAITISGGDLIATRNSSIGNGNWENIKGVIARTSGKYYVEFDVSGNSTVGGGNGSWACGLATLALFVTSNVVPGTSGNGAAYFPWTGLCLINGSSSTIQANAVAGGFKVCMAADLDNGKIYWRINNGNWNNSGSDNPATNTGGKAITVPGTGFFPMWGGAVNAAAATINLGDSAYGFTAPSGFGAWASNPTPPTFSLNPADRSIVNFSLYEDHQKVVGDGPNGGSWRAGRSTPAIIPASNKIYLEFTTILLSSAANMIVGFMNATPTFTSGGVCPGSDTNGIGYQSNGNTLVNGGNLITGSTYTVGDIVCVALDCGIQKFWARVNGGNWFNQAIGSQNPATNVGGASCSGLFASGNIFVSLGFFPAGTSSGAAVNFYGTPFAFTPPSGYVAPADTLTTTTGPLQTAVAMV